MKRRIAAALVLTLTLTCLPIGQTDAYVVPVVEAGPNLFTNVANQVVNYAALLEEILQYINMIERLALELQNLKHLTNPQYREVGSLIYGVAQYFRNTGESFSYADHELFSRYQDLFPGWETNPFGNAAEEEIFRTLAIRDTVLATFRALERQHRHAMQSQRDIVGYKNQALRADGNLEIAHAQANIAGFTAEEVSKVHLALTTQANLDAVKYADEIHDRNAHSRRLHAMVYEDLPDRPYVEYAAVRAGPWS